MNLEELEEWIGPGPGGDIDLECWLAADDVRKLVTIAKAALRYHEERHFYPLPKCHWPMCQAIHQLEDTLPMG